MHTVSVKALARHRQLALKGEFEDSLTKGLFLKAWAEFKETSKYGVGIVPEA